MKGEMGMYVGNVVEMQMKKCFLENAIVDETFYEGTVLLYDANEEKIHIQLVNANLAEISLDAVYDCIIHTLEGLVSCDGTVKERYQNEYGNVLEFLIGNGFYKISIK